MSFQYSSSTRYLGYEGDRPRQGPVRWSESQECIDTRRSARFSDHLKVKHDEGNSPSDTEFSSNSVAGHSHSHGRSSVGVRPPSPSPICSPTNSFSPACSPRGTPYAHTTRRHGEAYSRTDQGSSGPSNRGKRVVVGESNGGAVVAGPSSARSENSLATANMYSNRESKPAPENPEDEDNDEVREIYMTEERSRAGNGNNQIIRRPRQQNWSDTSMGSFISSDGESISLSTEFNNVLAAAAAAGSNVNSAQAAAESERLRSILEEVSPSRPLLPGIGEEEPTMTRSDEGDQTESNFNRRDNRDNMALVLASDDNDHTSTSNNTAAHYERNRDQRGGRDYLALVPMSGTHESSDRDAPMSSWDSQNNENERGLVNHGDQSRGERNGSTSSNSVRNWKEKGDQVATPKQLALAKVKRDKIEAKAVAWEEAKTAQVDNRFKREESIIMAWENEQRVKANIKMKKVERKLEEKRAKAFEKMQNEIARAHRKAEERRAIAEAKKGAENAKITEAVEKIRAFGRLPRKFLIF